MHFQNRTEPKGFPQQPTTTQTESIPPPPCCCPLIALPYLYTNRVMSKPFDYSKWDKIELSDDVSALLLPQQIH